jgi:hypothetical protein
MHAAADRVVGRDVGSATDQSGVPVKVAGSF